MHCDEFPTTGLWLGLEGVKKRVSILFEEERHPKLGGICAPLESLESREIRRRGVLRQLAIVFCLHCLISQGKGRIKDLLLALLVAWIENLILIGYPI